jgi:WD40 repeat protein
MNLPSKAAALAGLLLLVACGDEATRPTPRSLTFVAGEGTVDTIGADPVQALEIRVIGPDGKPAPGTPVLFESEIVGDGPYTTATMLIAPVVSTRFGVVVADTTDGKGQAGVRVRFGSLAGEGGIVVTVPTLGIRDTARYTVQPGAPARVLIAPRDTGVTIGRSFTLRAAVVDRYANARAESPAWSGTGGLTISGGSMTASGFGRYEVRATYPGIDGDSTSVAALPVGRIAATTATTGYLGGPLVMMDLDGGTRVEVPLEGTVYGLDWAPDGRVVVAPGGSDATLIAVSASGKIERFLSGSTASSEAYPSFSGDGKTVFFAGRAADAGDTENHLWRADADGTNVQATTIPLSFPWGTSYGPSPDASKMVFHSQIYDVHTETVTAMPLSVPSWRWSPKGDLIAFAGDVVGVVRPDGSGRRVLVSGFNLYGDQTIDWSGDGAYLVFRGRTGSLELVEVATGTRVTVPFTARFAQPALR